VCIYMGVKLRLSYWEKNIEWECYWNNFMYIYTNGCKPWFVTLRKEHRRGIFLK
jgi:hypothetical protein